MNEEKERDHISFNELVSILDRIELDNMNDIYEVKEEFDKDGNWKGYRIGVVDPKVPLKPIKPYNVPIKYDKNKLLDKEKSINGLQ